jgi:hypothetical protein
MDIANSLQDIGFLTDFRESALVYPVVMATHLACIALFGGMIFLTDLRLLGVALKEIPVSDVVNGLRWWKRLGFVIMVTCGLLLGTSEALKYAPNPYFWTKMTLLFLVGVHAVIFKPTIYDHPETLDNLPVMPSRAKTAGTISLILWLTIATMGRLIAYYEPKQKVQDQAQVVLVPPQVVNR